MPLSKRSFQILLLTVSVVVLLWLNQGEHSAEHGGGPHEVILQSFIWFAVAMVLARAFASLFKLINIPAVLGCITAGIVAGNFALMTGLDWLEPIKTTEFIRIIAEYAVVLLLFKIGLESNIEDIMSVGLRSLAVAIVGVVAPMVLGYVTLAVLMPGQSDVVYLFFGAALSATSIAITTRTFEDLGQKDSTESIMVRSAAVIDDVLGLVILAFVSSLAATSGDAEAVGIGSMFVIIAKAILLFAVAILFGQSIAPGLSYWVSRLEDSLEMKAAFVMGIGIVFAVLAYSVGLEMIVGAYAVGLALDPVHFRYFKEPEAIMELRERLFHNDTKCEKESRRILEATINKHSDKHIEDLIHGFVIFIVPVFFFYTGMQVDLASLVANPTILSIALAVSVAAIVGKYVSGWAAGPGVDKNTVGWAMVPRGEVGIVFANVGLSLGVLSADLFATVIIMVIVTTFAAPIVLAYRLSHKS
ncbi:MAG: cation:proton antiporter [Candidatus Thiodiazotropha lotti]|nr:cation:proton antiporter [Candidatus Thiodiazotropha endoloripes]MCG7902716.1 cation:proton antiporter [Candidatus Thiodiazotropha weberae]MCG7991007.1 cation:proton antiporter [Candidatus Thiodiazotropha lotti]MCG8001010.1 cation:proton antiporter [Candidatus Thiodiazotropha lotti]MCW4182661.1 cation:proton antiporter [Candidatus Thiodiazotropha weberae]MCW4192784.1 cation:proton antiporter [Candidatus Thiodiazotropha weberae]